jgi:hypothetical protein
MKLSKPAMLLAVMVSALSLSAQYNNHPSGPPPGNSWNYGPGPNNWDNSWNNRPSPGRGACFYTDTNFRGNKFCVRSGDQLPSLPGKFGDNISSIQVFGRGQVRVFNDRNFSGGSTVVGGNVPDLRTYKFKNGHTWNNRISSVKVG